MYTFYYLLFSKIVMFGNYLFGIGRGKFFVAFFLDTIVLCVCVFASLILLLSTRHIRRPIHQTSYYYFILFYFFISKIQSQVMVW